jgi:soluble lytic murein transglycosylase-like protein
MEAIFDVANANAPPTWALLAQARIESDFNPDAYNAGSGAIGAFQIKPGTAQQPGYGVPPMAIADLNDPAKACQFACDYLAGLRRYAAGGWALALLHYNVGEGADVATASPQYKALATLVALVEGEALPFQQSDV